MSKLLYIQASPRSVGSASITAASAFVAAYVEAHPDTVIEIIELFETELPAFDSVASQGKYAIIHGEEAPGAVKVAFARVVEFIEAFKSADIYVFAVPMWNFGIPYVLKHYLDLVIQPTYTFRATDDGYEGLLKEKRAFVAYARGGDYEGNDEVDFQKRYLEFALGFMGITEVESVVIQPTLAAGREKADEVRQAGIAQAQELARSL